MALRGITMTLVKEDIKVDNGRSVIFCIIMTFPIHFQADPFSHSQLQPLQEDCQIPAQIPELWKGDDFMPLKRSCRLSCSEKERIVACSVFFSLGFCCCCCRQNPKPGVCRRLQQLHHDHVSKCCVLQGQLEEPVQTRKHQNLLLHQG